MSETPYTPFSSDLFRRPKLIVLVGIPGTGKSTWSRLYFDPAQIVSTDEIRKEVHPGVQYDPEKNAEVFDIFHQRIGQRLADRRDAIADSTNCNEFARYRLQDLAGEYEAEYHVIAFSNTHQALHRNKGREWEVPPDAMDHMLEKWKDARDAILVEHCESLTVIERVG